MSLYNKQDFKGIIKNIFKMRTSAKGVSTISGSIQSFEEFNGQRRNYCFIEFVAFGKSAEDLNALELSTNEAVLLHGSLQENTYKDVKKIQLVVSSVVGLPNEERYHYKNDSPAPKTTNYQKKQETRTPPPKEETKQENPYSGVIDIPDDMPF